VVDDVVLTDTTTISKMTARYLVTRVFEDVPAEIEMVVEEHDVSVVDATANGTADAVAGYDLEGLTGSWRVDTRGRISELSMDLPDDVAPELAQQLDGTAAVVMPMPETSVGVGASWQASAPMDAGGVPSEMLTTTEVLELDEDSVLLGLTMSLDGESLACAFTDAMPPQAEALVDRLEFDGGGRIEVGYRSLVPNTIATSEMSLESSFLAPQGGTTVPMRMVIESAMDLSQQRGE
jgi:hypothetical protein